jgi:small redox-active disulfide protein 2
MNDEITQIIVEGHRIGMIGLSDVIQEVKQLRLDIDERIQRELLKRIKQQNYVPDSKTEEYGQALLREFKRSLGIEVNEIFLGRCTMIIKILGTGCAKCNKLEELAKRAVEELNANATVEKIKELDKIIDYGVMMTPGLVIDEQVKSAGKLPSFEQVKAWIQEADLSSK